MAMFIIGSSITITTYSSPRFASMWMYPCFPVARRCCGADEFIKLFAYTLTDYHRVVHLDADTLILHPMDELMGEGRRNCCCCLRLPLHRARRLPIRSSP